MVGVTGVDVYRSAFVARCEAVREPGQSNVDAPGICSPADHRRPGPRPARRAAARCQGRNDHHLRGGPSVPGARRRPDDVDLRCAHGDGLPRSPRRAPPALPAGLTLRPVRRSAGERPDGVPLEDAVAAVLRANPTMDDPAETFAAYLRSLPSSVRLLCAVDREGVVRATSGSSPFGAEARVFFVNTDPDWRRRGIGQGMTAAALLAARRSGARRACLDASDAGRSIYSRLGFETVSQTVRFFGRERNPVLTGERG